MHRSHATATAISRSRSSTTVRPSPAAPPPRSPAPCSTAARRTTADRSPTATSCTTATSPGVGPGGDATGVATDQQGLGTAYQFFWPSYGGNDTDFFQCSDTARSAGPSAVPSACSRPRSGLPTPDPQWPFEAGANFAVNPVNGSDVVISSSVGRIFATQNEGVTWFDIGDPGGLRQPEQLQPRPGLRCPRPHGPARRRQPRQLHLRRHADRPDLRHPGRRRQRHEQQLDQYLRRPGRNAGRGDHHRPHPRQPRRLRRHHRRRVLHRQLDSVANRALGQHHRHRREHIHNLAYSIFGQAYNPTTDGNSVTLNQAVTLSSIVADWRYQISNSTPPNPSKGTSSRPLRQPRAARAAPVRASTSRSTTARPGHSSPARLIARSPTAAIFPTSPVTDLDVSLGNVNTDDGHASPGRPATRRRLHRHADQRIGKRHGSVDQLGSASPGDTISGNGIPAGTTIRSINRRPRASRSPQPHRHRLRDSRRR